MMRFFGDERGGLLPFTIIVLGTIIILGALAVNTVRVEHRRTVAQSVLDICVLNAAAQRQSLPPRAVLDDCLAKHGFEGTISNFNATTGRTKSVTASAELELESFFLQDPVIYEIGVQSAAQEELTNLEIVLALDVSNSMNIASSVTTHPLTDLKAAAGLFVEQILKEDTAGKIMITVVPYNSQVNLGATLAEEFTLVGAPINMMQGTTRIGPDVTQKRCVDLPASSYTSTAVTTTQLLPAMPFIDMLGGTRQQNARTALTDANFAVPTLQENLCSFFRLHPSPATNNVVFPPDFGSNTLRTPEQRITALKGKINGLIGTSETSINVGMRWALAFLDPAMQSAFQGLRESNLMPPTTLETPRSFDDSTAIKVIVLMSDGTNQDEPRMRPIYQNGLSPFWMGNDGNISWFNAARPGPNRFWVPHVAAPAGSPAGTAPGIWQAVPWQNATNTGTPARQMDYNEVWRRMKVSYVAWEFHARSVNQTTGTGAARTAANNARAAAFAAAMEEYLPASMRVTAANKDNQLTTACNLARSKNVFVYSILFESGTTNSPTLQACARDPSFFYRAADPAALTQAFASIALHISKLQLTD